MRPSAVVSERGYASDLSDRECGRIETQPPHRHTTRTSMNSRRYSSDGFAMKVLTRRTLRQLGKARKERGKHRLRDRTDLS